MDDKIFDQIHDVDLKKTMESSYIDYAMSVIAQRALPDVRDGLKPVQRRVLYSMIELNNGPDKPHRKCARIVGDTMGKYHPHGDSSIYGALVNMAQDWSFVVRTSLRRKKSLQCFRPVFRTCWSTVRPVSQSEWRPIFRRTICARSLTVW